MLNSKMRAQYDKDVQQMIDAQNEKMHTLVKPVKGSHEKVERKKDSGRKRR